jgi:hypothetical protein
MRPVYLGVALIALLGLAGALLVPVGGGRVISEGPKTRGGSMDLSSFSTDAISTEAGAPLRLLFIHHSCGGQLLAPPGPDAGEQCIYDSHPNAGDLRRALEANGYEVHEASYGSRLGQDTDLFHWLPKFRDQMNAVLACDRQDQAHADGEPNRIVMFKSCYPNNAFTEEGQEPGSPAGPALTVANAKATVAALLPLFAAHPDVLFVYVTAPPLAPHAPSERLWKWGLKKALGKPSAADKLTRGADLARRFHDWARDPAGWLKGYDGKNVVVFDYYDVLTGGGRSNLSVYPSGDGRDSHPAAEGNALAAKALVPSLNQAARRAGLAP